LVNAPTPVKSAKLEAAPKFGTWAKFDLGNNKHKAVTKEITFIFIMVLINLFELQRTLLC
jgi:hypothetical protein